MSSSRKHPYRAVFFDLDGTLLDTAADLGGALNEALRHTGHRGEFAPADASRLFGSGVTTAIRRALIMERGGRWEDMTAVGTAGENRVLASLPDPVSAAFLDEEAARIRTFFTPWYNEHCADRTKPYPGIPGMVADLRDAGVALGVISNKTDPAVQKLIPRFFGGMFNVVMGTGENRPRKPDPFMVNEALAALGVTREEAAYVGDTEIDIETAAAAGLVCCCVAWGFRTDAFLREHGAEAVFQSAGELEGALLVPR